MSRAWSVSLMRQMGELRTTEGEPNRDARLSCRPQARQTGRAFVGYTRARAKPPSKSRSTPSRSTVATATPKTSPSNASCATRSSAPSARARARCNGSSSPEVCSACTVWCA